MQNFPKYSDILTHYDVEQLLKVYPNETKTFLKELTLDIYKWETADEIIQPEAGLEDVTHQLEPVWNNNVLIGYKQQTLVIDTNARLFRLGYTLEQVKTILNDSTIGE